jgi:D-glycero-D-manno-heptose 1,7-bisphosphate phosphatase
VRPAVFLDRDGTLIELVHHLSDPRDVRLLPRAGAAVRALRKRGYACVIVTNQSAIGRGLLTVEGLGQVQAEFSKQLAECDTEIDGFYFCAVMPGIKDPTVIEHPDRKPGPGMLLRAASELGLDLSRSFMIGDTVSDVLAGKNAGVRATILVRTGYGSQVPPTFDSVDHVVDDIWAAVELIERQDAALATSGGTT